VNEIDVFQTKLTHIQSLPSPEQKKETQITREINVSVANTSIND